MNQEAIRNGKNFIQQGEDELIAKDYERALVCFKKAYAKDPKCVSVIINMGFCYAKLEKFSQAQECFTTALDMSPKNSIAKRNLARILGPQAKFSSSKREPLQKSPQNEEIQFVRFIEWGSKNQKNGYLFSAIQYFQAASNIHPEFIDPYLRIASCYEKLHEKEKAVAAYEQALSIYPKDEAAQEGIKRCGRAIHNPKNKEEPYRGNNNDLIEREPAKESIPTPVPPKLDAIEKTLSHSNDENVPIHRADLGVGAVVGKSTAEEMNKHFLSKYIDDFLSHKWSTPGPLESSHPNNVPIIEENKKTTVPRIEEKEEAFEWDAKETDQISLTEEQVDALLELGNIGASHAATTLATILETPMYMNVSDICVLCIDEISEYIGNDEATFVTFTVEGEIQQAGYLILQVENNFSTHMSAIMLDIPNESRRMNEMDEDAFTEIGNIIVSAFLNGAAELLDIIMLPSPPRTIVGKAMPVIHDIIDNGDINCDNILLFKTEMMCSEYELTCNILMFPSQIVLYNILQMLERLIEEDEANDRKRSSFASYADWY